MSRLHRYHSPSPFLTGNSITGTVLPLNKRIDRIGWSDSFQGMHPVEHPCGDAESICLSKRNTNVVKWTSFSPKCKLGITHAWNQRSTDKCTIMLKQTWKEQTWSMSTGNFRTSENENADFSIPKDRKWIYFRGIVFRRLVSGQIIFWAGFRKSVQRCWMTVFELVRVLFILPLFHFGWALRDFRSHREDNCSIRRMVIIERCTIRSFINLLWNFSDHFWHFARNSIRYFSHRSVHAIIQLVNIDH